MRADSKSLPQPATCRISRRSFTVSHERHVMNRIRHHKTEYYYNSPVIFGAHRALVRPREGHDVHIESSVLEIEPQAHVQWHRDIYGNSIAVLNFTGLAQNSASLAELPWLIRLRIPSTLSLIQMPCRILFNTPLTNRRSSYLTVFPAIRRKATLCASGFPIFTCRANSPVGSNCSKA